MRIVTYLIEYLGEFEFIFETVLGYVSGDQMGSFKAEKTESKISRLGTFKIFVKMNTTLQIYKKEVEWTVLHL